MKARSMWNPWAIACIGTKNAPPVKHVETTRQTTQYRGPLLIASTRAMPVDCQELVLEEPYASQLREYGVSNFDMPNGYLLGVRVLKSIGTTDDALEQGRISEQERMWGDYSAGRNAWYFTPDVYVFKVRVPVVGKQMLFDVNFTGLLVCYHDGREMELTLADIEQIEKEKNAQ